MGISVSAGPSAATTTASAAVAAPTPTSEERQPRVSPAASTIVSASTISTALARKVDAKRRTSFIANVLAHGNTRRAGCALNQRVREGTVAIPRQVDAR